MSDCGFKFRSSFSLSSSPALHIGRSKPMNRQWSIFFFFRCCVRVKTKTRKKRNPWNLNRLVESQTVSLATCELTQYGPWAFLSNKTLKTSQCERNLVCAAISWLRATDASNSRASAQTCCRARRLHLNHSHGSDAAISYKPTVEDKKPNRRSKLMQILMHVLGGDRDQLACGCVKKLPIERILIEMAVVYHNKLS